MKSRLVRIIGTVVVGGLVSLASGGVASAEPADGATTTHTAAAQLRQLHDQIATAARARDVGAAQASVDTLRPILGQLEAAPVAPPTRNQIHRADDLAGQVQRDMWFGHAGLWPIVHILLYKLAIIIKILIRGLPILLPLLPWPWPLLPWPLP